MWNPSTYDCECNKADEIDEYLDIKNCSRGKHPIGKLVLCLLLLVVIFVSCYFYYAKYRQNKNIYYDFTTSALN